MENYLLYRSYEKARGAVSPGRKGRVVQGKNDVT
jgi:hypothetical protein